MSSSIVIIVIHQCLSSSNMNVSKANFSRDEEERERILILTRVIVSKINITK